MTGGWSGVLRGKVIYRMKLWGGLVGSERGQEMRSFWCDSYVANSRNYYRQPWRSSSGDGVCVGTDEGGSDGAVGGLMEGSNVGYGEKYIVG